MKIALLTLAASAVVAGTHAADVCPNLCLSKPQTLTVQGCVDQTVTAMPDGYCCDDGTGASNCEDGRKCRSVEFTTDLGCSEQGVADPCIMPAKVVHMDISILIQSDSGSCCSKCDCHGDPHCSSFLGKSSDYIICESRNVKAGCSLSQGVCTSQLDTEGNKCVWNAAQQSCLQSPSSPVSTMLFYKKGTTAVSFMLGDRGVISILNVTEGTNKLSLSAADCRSNNVDPWIGTPVGTLQRQKYGQQWVYQLTSANANLIVQCVSQGTVAKGPHLDVQIIAQGVKPGVAPPGVTGYCATGVIDYGKATHDITDAIKNGGLCNNQPNADTAVNFNGGFPVSKKKLPIIVTRFCQKYMLGFQQINKGKGLVKVCYKNIMGKGKPGWAAQFCAASTTLTKMPEDCTTVACNTCITDIQDYGWTYAIEKWGIKTNNAGNDAVCIPTSQLPPDLTQCQAGIRIQYMDPATNDWVTYKAIPSGYTLCKGSGGFDSDNDPLLFNNKIRFIQCSLPPLTTGQCPNQDALLCNANDGFTVSVTTKIDTVVPALDVVSLVDKGTLICNPKLYPGNPKGCFNEPLNPCPTCTGACKGSGYVSPCGPATADTCSTCLDPFALF